MNPKEHQEIHCLASDEVEATGFPTFCSLACHYSGSMGAGASSLHLATCVVREGRLKLDMHYSMWSTLISRLVQIGRCAYAVCSLPHAWRRNGRTLPSGNPNISSEAEIWELIPSEAQKMLRLSALFQQVGLHKSDQAKSWKRHLTRQTFPCGRRTCVRSQCPAGNLARRK
jgi:hypothetical protein